MTIPIENVEILNKHFAYFPNFHDNEILSLNLDRKGPNLILILYSFEISSEIDTEGKYKRLKECYLKFSIEGIKSIELKNFNHQNVLNRLSFEKINNEIKIIFEPNYGLEGFIFAEKVKLVSLSKCC